MSGPGQVPGIRRAAYDLSLVVPPGTKMKCQQKGSAIKLSMGPQEIPPGDPRNPTANPAEPGSGVTLRRTWTINIDEAAVLSGAQVHGTITEQTTGFLPGNQPVTSTGSVFLTPHGKTELAPLEAEE